MKYFLETTDFAIGEEVKIANPLPENVQHINRNAIVVAHAPLYESDLYYGVHVRIEVENANAMKSIWFTTFHPGELEKIEKEPPKEERASILDFYFQTFSTSVPTANNLVGTVVEPTEKASAAMEELGIVPTPKPSMLESMVEVTKKQSRSDQIKDGHARKAAELGLSLAEYHSQNGIQRRGPRPQSYWGTSEIAKVSGRSPRTIRNFLRRRYPDWDENIAFRIPEKEGEAIIKELSEYGLRLKHKKPKALPVPKRTQKPAVPAPVVEIPKDVLLKTVATDSSIAQLQARLLGPAARIEKDDPEPAIARETLASNAQNKCCDRCGKIIWANPNKDGTMGTWLTNGYPHFPSFCIASDQRGTVAPVMAKKGRK